MAILFDAYTVGLVGDGCQSYEATRKCGVVGKQRRRRSSTHAPELGTAVFGGIVRGVYRIEAWEQPPDEDSGRWGVRGTRGPDMEALYLHRDVAGYLRGADTGRASQNPL